MTHTGKIGRGVGFSATSCLKTIEEVEFIDSDGNTVVRVIEYFGKGHRQSWINYYEREEGLTYVS